MSTTETGSGSRSCPTFEAFDPAGDAQIADPFTTWAIARQEAPVFFSPVLNTYVVTRYDHLCEILTDAETFSSSDILRPLKPNPPEVDEILATGFDATKMGAMVMYDAPEHSNLRRATAAAFTPRRVAVLEDEVRAAAEEYIDAIIATGPSVDFVEAFAYPLPLRIIARLLGVPWEDAVKLHEWAIAKLALQFGDMALDEHIEMARRFVEFQGYAYALIEERRAAPKDDLISSMVLFETDAGEPLDDLVLVGQVIGLVMAGHETVTTMLTTGLYHLLEDRSQWDALRANPELAVAATEEALRFDGPVKLLFRRPTRDVELGGCSIPEGAKIAIVLGSGNRDELAFTAPERFDIHADRSRQHLAFGRGPHYCVGASLARAEGRIAFQRLSERLPSLRFEAGAPLEFARNVSVRMPLALHVEWDPR
jgi:cytochrome P450